MAQSVDPQLLSKRFSEIRAHRKLTLQQVAEETKISVATLSRVERGEIGAIKADTLAALSEWMEIRLDRFVGSLPVAPGKKTGNETLPEIVELHLRADKQLDSKSAKALADLFKSVYEQVAEQTKKR